MGTLTETCKRTVRHFIKKKKDAPLKKSATPRGRGGYNSYTYILTNPEATLRPTLANYLKFTHMHCFALLCIVYCTVRKVKMEYRYEVGNLLEIV